MLWQATIYQTPSLLWFGAVSGLKMGIAVTGGDGGAGDAAECGSDL